MQGRSYDEMIKRRSYKIKSADFNSKKLTETKCFGVTAANQTATVQHPAQLAIHKRLSKSLQQMTQSFSLLT